MFRDPLSLFIVACCLGLACFQAGMLIAPLGAPDEGSLVSDALICAGALCGLLAPVGFLADELYPTRRIPWSGRQLWGSILSATSLCLLSQYSTEVPRSIYRRWADCERISHHVKRTLICGRVVGEGVTLADGTIEFQLSVPRAQGDDLANIRGPRLPWVKSVPLHVGAWVCARVAVRRRQDEPNIWGFDGYLARRGFIGYFQSDRVTTILGGDFWLSGTKQSILRGLFEAFPDSPALEVLVGSAFGYSHVVGEDLIELFRQTGTLHLLIVSGSHLGALMGALRLLSGIIAGVFIGGGLPCSRLTLDRVLGTTVLTGFVLMVGNSPTMLRALVVALLSLLVSSSNSRKRSLQWLAISFLGVNLVWPGCFFELGCELTYAACTALWISCATFRRPVLNPQAESLRRRILENTYLAVTSCILVSILTRPLLLAHTGVFTPLSSLINLFVIPIHGVFWLILGLPALIAYSFAIPGSVTAMNALLESGDFAINYAYYGARWLERSPARNRRLESPEDFAVLLGLQCVESILLLLLRKFSAKEPV